MLKTPERFVRSSSEHFHSLSESSFSTAWFVEDKVGWTLLFQVLSPKFSWRVLEVQIGSFAWDFSPCFVETLTCFFIFSCFLKIVTFFETDHFIDYQFLLFIQSEMLLILVVNVF